MHQLREAAPLGILSDWAKSASLLGAAIDDSRCQKLMAVTPGPVPRLCLAQRLTGLFCSADPSAVLVIVSPPEGILLAEVAAC